MKTLVLALALLSLTGAQARPSAMFDPAGKWTFSTADDSGASMSGTMEITGRPGAYTGTIVNGTNPPLPINDVLTSATGAVILANPPDGGVVVIKVWQTADGKIQCGWGQIRNVLTATVTRAK